jgi:hypothetical protein
MQFSVRIPVLRSTFLMGIVMAITFLISCCNSLAVSKSLSSYVSSNTIAVLWSIKNIPSWVVILRGKGIKYMLVAPFS